MWLSNPNRGSGRNHWRLGLSFLLMSQLLVSCAQSVNPGGAGDTRTQLDGSNTGSCGDRFAVGEGLELSVARDLHQQGRSRSALAHLEALALSYPDAILLQADALRSIGDFARSNELYQQLTETCLASSAHRGLALNAFEARQLPSALRLMTLARYEAPTDADIRNDLGYLMMLDGNHTAAEEELLTALELDAAHRNAAQNLVMLYFHRGLQDRAYRTARIYGLQDSTVLALSENVGQGAGGE